MTGTPSHSAAIRATPSSTPVAAKAAWKGAPNAAPYAGPRTTTATAPAPTSARLPYVPQPLRTRPQGEPLPWISDFLDSDAHAHVESTEGRVHASAEVAAEDHADREEASWPLQDAGAEMQSLAGMLPSPESIDDASATLLHAPLPMWSDEDMLDIMPVHRASGSTESSDAVKASASDAPTEDAAPSGAMNASPDAAPAGTTAEAAALALETLARRVRQGELPLPGYAPELGDAAALAAALAALLGVRR